MKKDEEIGGKKFLDEKKGVIIENVEPEEVKIKKYEKKGVIIPKVRKKGGQKNFKKNEK